MATSNSKRVVRNRGQTAISGNISLTPIVSLGALSMAAKVEFEKDKPNNTIQPTQ